MAQIVLALGVSHSPMLTLDWTEWEHRAKADLANDRLNLSDGRFVSYAELVAEVGERWSAISTPEQFAGAAARCKASLDRAAAALTKARPDVVLVVGDDQGELFARSNTPAISVYYGDEVVTNDVWGRPENPDWMRTMARGYAMDYVHRFAAAPEMARALIAGLIAKHVDIGAASHVENPVTAGFGHAFGFIADRLFRDQPFPMLPVLLNTYFPPNVMTAGRALDIGIAIREVLEAVPGDARVAVVASGGLSHFVVDEVLDRRVMDGLAPDRHALLRDIPPEALHSGSSEILNWIMTAAIAGDLLVEWVDYQPIRRTPAGTGVGVAFACWSSAAAG